MTTEDIKKEMIRQGTKRFAAKLIIDELTFGGHKIIHCHGIPSIALPFAKWSGMQIVGDLGSFGRVGGETDIKLQMELEKK